MCGVVGIIDTNQINQKIFDSLTMLQHRGQDAAGIATYDGYKLYLKKGKGLVVDVIKKNHMNFLKGNIGIGHIRYPTAGSNNKNEAQPFFVNSPYGIALAHNGNLINTKIMRTTLINNDHRYINTNSDSEILLNILAAELAKIKKKETNFNRHMFFTALSSVFKRCIGGYAVVGILVGIGLFAFRDPKGIRPLALGIKKNNNTNNCYIVASETVAFNWDNYKLVDDIKPGQGIIIDTNFNFYSKICAKNTSLNTCLFEYVYLARPDSIIDGACVYSSRLEMGYKIANKILKIYKNNNIDSVIPIPDSGRYSALSIAFALKLPYREGFVKNRYVGRTFIMPNQHTRTNSIKKKLNTIDNEFLNKHVLLVDDSIVRGNTSKLIVDMAKKAGTKKISLVSTSPVVKFPNVYGIDMPTYKELIGNKKNINEIAEWIGVDNLFYQDLEDLIYSVKKQSLKLHNFDTSVFDGKYIAGNITVNN